MRRVRQGSPCRGCLVSTPDEAAEAKARGASWLVASHAGTLSQGCPRSVIGLMPFADANGLVLEMGKSLADAADGIPLLAGVLAADQFRVMDSFLARLRRAGYAGVQNFPSTGILSGRVRALFESADMGYAREAELIRKASGQGLFCSAVVFSPADAGGMRAAGADMLVAHPPLTEDGDVQAWNAENSAFLREKNISGKDAEHALTAGFIMDSAQPAFAMNPAQYESVESFIRGQSAEQSARQDAS